MKPPSSRFKVVTCPECRQFTTQLLEGESEKCPVCGCWLSFADEVPHAS